MQDFPELMPEYADRRVYGAVAYLKSHESVNVHAGRQGLFVIRATGSSASIANAPGFTPRAFGRRRQSRNGPPVYPDAGIGAAAASRPAVPNSVHGAAGIGAREAFGAARLTLATVIRSLRSPIHPIP